jgi:hypothetical protein
MPPHQAWRREVRAFGLWVVTPVAVLLALTLALKERLGVPAGHLTRDPLAVLNAPPHVGLLSNVGVLLWAVSATACLFCAAVVGRRAGGTRRFLLASGALTTVLLLDDLFMLHEAVLPGSFGIPEKVVFGFYAFATLSYLFTFRADLLAWRSAPFAAALGLFAVSVASDIVLPNSARAQFAEDAFKLAGIASWCAYYLRTCAAAARDAFAVGQIESPSAARSSPATCLILAPVSGAPRR